MIINARKYLENLQQKKEQEQPESEEEPDWNSDEDIDPNMESKHIEAAIVEKVVERMGDNYVRKQNELKRHEKEFLEDYFRKKHQQEEEEAKTHTQPLQQPPDPPLANDSHPGTKQDPPQ